MDLGKLAKVFNKPQTSPSGQYDDPINVAIGTFKPGESTKTMEELIVATMSNLIYGDSGKNKYKISDISGFAKKGNNPIDLATKQLNKLNDIKNIASNIASHSSYTVDNLETISTQLMLLNTMGAGIMNILSKPQESVNGDTVQKMVSVIIDAPDLTTLLNTLSELSNNDVFSSLALSFETMKTESEGLEDVTMYLNSLQDSLTKLIESEDKITKFSASIDPLIANFNKLNEIKRVETDNIQSVINVLMDLSTATLDTNELNNINTSITSFINGIAEIPELDNSKIEYFNSVIDKISQINISNVANISSDLQEKLFSLNRIRIPLQGFINDLNNHYTDMPNKKVFDDFQNILNNISNINTNNLTNINSDLLNENIENLKPIIEKLKIFNIKQDLDKESKNIANISQILNILDSLEFIGSKTINIDKFEEVGKLIKNHLAKIIISLEEDFNSTNSNNLNKIIENIYFMLNSLDKLVYLGNSEINYEKLQSLNKDKIIESIGSIYNTFNNLNIKKIIDQQLLDNINNLLNNIDNFKFVGENEINKDKLEKLNNSLIIIGAISNNLSNTKVKYDEKSINNIVSLLNSLDKIIADNLSTKDYSKLIDNLVELKNISNIINTFNSKDTENIDLVSTFIENFITDKTSPISLLSSTNLITDFINKEKEINKFVETTKSLFEVITTITSSNLDSNTIDNYIKSITDFATNINNMNTLSIEEDKINTLTDSLTKLEALNNYNLTNIGGLVDNINKINPLIEGVSNINIIDPALLDNFKNFIKIIGDIEYNVNDIPKEFVSNITGLSDRVLPRIEIIFEKLEKLHIDSSIISQIENLNNVISEISKIKIDKSADPISEYLINNIKLLGDVAYGLGDLAMYSGNINVVNPDNIDKLAKIINSVNKIKFDKDKSVKIDTDILIDTLSGLPKVAEILEEFDKEFNDFDFKKLQQVTGQLSNVLISLDKLEFNGEAEIDENELNEFVASYLPPIKLIISELGKIDINNVKNSELKLSIISDVLKALDKVNFFGGNTINKNKINDFNSNLPTIINIVTALDKIKIENSAKNAKNLKDTLKIIAKIDTKAFENKDFSKIVDTLTVVGKLNNAVSSFDSTSITNVELLNSFVKEFFNDKNSFLYIISGTDFSAIKEKTKEIKNTIELIESVSNLAKTVAILGVIGPLVYMGAKVLTSFVESIYNIAKSIQRIDPKTVNIIMQTMKGMAIVIAISTICMFIGGYFVVQMPQLVIGALGFAIALGAFLFLTISAIKFGSKALKTNLETAKGLAILIAACSFIMILGATIVLNFPKIIIGAFAFAIALGAFLSLTLLAIRLGTIGMKGAMSKLTEVAILIVASGFLLMLAAAVFTIPGLWGNAIGFAFMLSGFLLAVIIAINGPELLLKYFGMSFGDTAKYLKQYAIIIVAGGLLLMLAAAVFTIPGLWGNAIGFAFMLSGFLLITIGAVNIASRGIKDALKNIKQFGVFIIIAASTLVIGGLLFMLMPELPNNVLLFGAILTGFILATSFAMKILDKSSKHIIKGAIAMAIIAGVVLIASSAMLVIKKAMSDGWENIAIGATIMSATLLAVAGMTILMGTQSLNPLFWAGVAVMGAISGIILVASTSMLLIAKSMKIFQDIGEIDFQPILNNITGFIEIAKALIPIGKYSLFIVLAATAIGSISKTISDLSETVADVAALKIPIYIGTKKVGYRQLTNNDFNLVSTNIKNLVSCIGGALIDLYNKKPEMFDTGVFGMRRTPFSIVVNSVSKLGKLISEIAKGVKDYASLTIPVYNGTKIVKYDKLTKADFINAGENIKTIISVLSNALIDLYNKNKNMYSDKSFMSNLFGGSSGNTPLSKVINVSSKLGSLISSIAKGVQSMANLYIPEYNAKGEIIKHNKLNPEDFTNATDNVVKIVTVISNALIDLYNSDSNLFDEGKKSPIFTVLNFTNKIGSLMSDIAKGVQSMANLKIPIYGKEGKIDSYQNMNKEDIINAGVNVKKIVITISRALIDLYNSDSNLFDDNKKSPIYTVVEASTRIGKMISEIASGVQSFGKLLIPIEWNKEGKAIKFKQMTSDDITNASLNIQRVIGVLGTSLMNTYENHTDWYDNKIDKSKFGIVINTNIKLAKLISDIGKAVGNMAALKIAIDWDKEGKPIKYETLKEQHFNDAGNNISKIIEVLGNGIMKVYTDHSDWFEDDKNKILDPKKSKFGIVLTSIMGMSELISGISKAMVNYAKLRIPDQWDKEGKPIHYIEVGKNYFEQAGKNIKAILTNSTNAIEDLAKKDIFKNGKDDPTFKNVLESCISLSSLISSISSSVISMAQMMIPIEWNKDGKPIKFREMNEKDFNLASNNIGKILTTIGGTIIKLYEDDKQKGYGMFDIKEDDSESMFMKVSNSCLILGEVIKNIGVGVSEISNLEATLKKQGITIDYNKVANNIKDVITVIGNAIMTTFNDKSDWFKKPVRTSGSILFGLVSYGEEGSDDSPFQTVLNCCASMGQMIINIADGVKYFQDIIGDKNIKFDVVGKNIGDVITAIGNSIMAVVQQNRFYDIDKLEPIISSVNQAANAVHSITDLVVKISNKEIVETDSKGAVTNKIQLDDNTLTSAATMISNIVTCVYKALDNDEIKKYKNNKNLPELLDNINKAITIVGKNASILAQLSIGKIIDSEGKKIISFNVSNGKVFSTAGRFIKSILTTVASGIANAYDEINKNNSGFWGIGKADNSDFSNMLNSIDKGIETVAKNAEILANLSSGKIGNITFTLDEVKKATEIIKTVLTEIAGGVYEATNKVRLLFGTDIWENSLPYKTLIAVDMAKLTVANMGVFLANLSNNKLEYIDENNKKQSIKVTGEQLSSAATILGNIISSVTSGINNGIDSIYDVKDRLYNIKDLNLYKSVHPIINDLKLAANALENTGDMNFIGKISFGFVEDKKTPLQSFMSNIDSLIKQANDIANSSLDKSYKTLQNALTSTNETVNNFALPTNFKEQTESLDTFIKSVNSVEIKGVDSLTELLRQLNKLGINMGNMDKLVDAISKKLSRVLKETSISMDKLTKELKDDAERKAKHEEQVKNSVSKIKEVMNQTMNVTVKMEDNPTQLSSTSGAEGSEDDLTHN